jgi:hypothetical protein
LSVTDRRTVWRRFTSGRSWRKRVPLMVFVLGLAITVFGVWGVVDYYVVSAPSEFHLPYQIEVVWSNVTGPHRANQREPFEVSVFNGTTIYFGFHFKVQGNGTFTTVIALPYKVVGAQSGTGEWYMISVGENGTIVYSVSKVESTPSGIIDSSIILVLNQTLRQDDRGVKTTTLSLGAYIPSGLKEELSTRGLNYTLVGGANYTISFIVPEDARNLQSFPTYNGIIPYQIDHRIQVIWNIVGFNTVTLSYSLEKEVQFYQDELARGSFSLGLGIPTMLAPILSELGNLDLEERIRSVLHEGDQFARRNIEGDADENGDR